MKVFPREESLICPTRMCSYAPSCMAIFTNVKFPCLKQHTTQDFTDRIYWTVKIATLGYFHLSSFVNSVSILFYIQWNVSINECLFTGLADEVWKVEISSGNSQVSRATWGLTCHFRFRHQAKIKCLFCFYLQIYSLYFLHRR